MSKVSHEEYLDKLDSLNSNVYPLETYVKSQVKIKHICKRCGHVFETTPNQVLNALKKNIAICRACSGKKLFVGKNDLWTTHPEIAKLLDNPQDGYSVTKASDKKLNWHCPKCNTLIVSKSVNNTVKSGLTCPICSKGRSMGHRIVNAILEVCHLPYRNEVSFEWSNGKRYDVVVNDDCIIEINGEQHYKDSYLLKLSKTSLEKQKQNDIIKRNMAINNGFKYYIIIDASVSDYTFILNSIKSNVIFKKYIDLTSSNRFEDIKWEDVFKKYDSGIIWKVL